MTMQFSLCGQVGGMSFFCRPEISNVNLSSVVADGGSPRIGLPDSTPVNTTKSGPCTRIGGNQVLVILGGADQPQIQPSVVSLDAIDMVNRAAWPEAGHVKPCQPVGTIQPTVHTDSDVAVYEVSAPGFGPCKPSADSRSAEKFSGLRIVMEKFAQNCCAKIGFSHDALQLLIGQRPRRVGSTSRLRYFASAPTLCVEASWP